MILRITLGKVKPGSWPDFQRAYNANVEKFRRRRVKGLRARWLAEDLNDSNSGYTISLWATEADLRAYEQSDFLRNEILPPLQPFFLNQYTTTNCDVKVVEDYVRRAPAARRAPATRRAPAARRMPAARRAAPAARRAPAASRRASASRTTRARR